MRRMAVGMGLVAALGLVACSSGSGSVGSASSAASTPSTTGRTTGSSGTSGSTGSSGTSDATGATRVDRRITAPDGTELVVKPPRPSSGYAAKVVYADPITPTSTFTASDHVQGVPLSELGDWAARPDGSSATTTASEGGAVVATPAAMGQTPGTSTPPAPPTDLCTSDPQSDCIIYSTGWVRLAADAGTTSSISCPADHPYIEGTWQLVSNPLTNGGQSWKLNPTWDWQRDHWTITVWQLGTASGGNGVTFGAQNWNTVFGDAWHYEVVIPCSATKPVPPSS